MGRRFQPIALYKWTCLECNSSPRDKALKCKGRKQGWNPKYKANRSLYRHKKDIHPNKEKITILFEKTMTKTGEKTSFLETV